MSICNTVILQLSGDPRTIQPPRVLASRKPSLLAPNGFGARTAEQLPLQNVQQAISDSPPRSLSRQRPDSRHLPLLRVERSIRSITLVRSREPRGCPGFHPA
ncbi:Uu.00g026050.m01.CDS01 [Anthostomella pinea]|uniref:Uu.00g026050.m01.CDS01 n=1 Tax=Anthostomella pinea TaxID=933095 RepID=A0AAI8V813_9PEZI|nr:Uu.00g026050.m01.CDS01 [Anthostomella pinea]